MANDIPQFWSEEAELLDLQAQQYQVSAIPEIKLRFMTYCTEITGNAYEQTLQLHIDGLEWRLLRREYGGISWEIYSPDGVVAYSTNSQIENRLDREILDYRARLLASEDWENTINQRLSRLRNQLWKWPQGQTLTLYWLEWEGFKKDEAGWTSCYTPDAEGFVRVWQGSEAVGILLERTLYFIKRYTFDQLKDLPQELKIQRQLQLKGIERQGHLYVEVPDAILTLAIGLEPLPWVVEAFKTNSGYQVNNVHENRFEDLG